MILKCSWDVFQFWPETRALKMKQHQAVMILWEDVYDDHHQSRLEMMTWQRLLLTDQVMMMTSLMTWRWSPWNECRDSRVASLWLPWTSSLEERHDHPLLVVQRLREEQSWVLVVESSFVLIFEVVFGWQVKWRRWAIFWNEGNFWNFSTEVFLIRELK